jgi:hypothetical protein
VRRLFAGVKKKRGRKMMKGNCYGSQPFHALSIAFAFEHPMTKMQIFYDQIVNKNPIGASDGVLYVIR